MIRLAIFDVDGVIKQKPDPYMLLHEHFGTVVEGRQHFADFRLGRISYDEFAQLDAGSWKGQALAEVKQVLRANPYVAGAHAAALGLRERGIPLLLLSSGLDVHVEDIAADLNADEFICNHLNHDGEHILGTMTVHVPWGGKGPIVREMIERWGVDPADCLAVGDSDTDIFTFNEVGHAVAVRPRSTLVSQSAHLTLPDLNGLLDFIDSIQ